MTPPSRRLRLAFLLICPIGWVALLVFKLRNVFLNFGFSAGLSMCLFVAGLVAVLGFIVIRQVRAVSRQHPNTTNGPLR